MNDFEENPNFFLMKAAWTRRGPGKFEFLSDLMASRTSYGNASEIFNLSGLTTFLFVVSRIADISFPSQFIGAQFSLN